MPMTFSRIYRGTRSLSTFFTSLTGDKLDGAKGLADGLHDGVEWLRGLWAARQHQVKNFSLETRLPSPSPREDQTRAAKH